MAFVKVCELEDLWEGEMGAFEVDGNQVLLLHVDGGEITAFQGMCPHQQIALVDGHFDGKELTCKAHQWVFDGVSGKGINPDDCRLAKYAVKVEGEDVLVDIDGVVPLFSLTQEDSC